MGREPDADGGRELGPAPDEFDAIVSAWRREGDVPVWPDDEPDRDESADPGAALLFEPAPTAPGGLPVTRPWAREPVDEEHFVPPEPPPLPRLGPPAMVGLGLIVVGLVLVIVPGWLGVPVAYGLPLGLLGLAAGLGWLVLRLWPDPPSADDRDDDGAVL